MQTTQDCKLDNEIQILLHMGDSRKCQSGYLKTDLAEILYKYQMYFQGKFSNCLNDLEHQNHFKKWQKLVTGYLL